MTKFDRLIERIKGYNKGSYYKIRLLPLKEGFTIFLDLRAEGKTDKTYTKFHLSGNSNPTQADMEAVGKAQEKQIYYNELFKNQELNSLNNKAKKNSKVIPFFEAQRDSHQETNTRKGWNNTLNHFREYAGEKITFQEINIDFCKEFKAYLLTKVNPYSTSTYFSIFKRMLNAATEKGVYVVSPAHQVKNSKPESHRDFLTYEEWKLLKDTELIDGHGKSKPEVSRAFLFACVTGLRLSDIINLKWENIVDKDYFQIKVIKTKRFLRNKLSESAKEIIEQQKQDHPKSESVFILPKSGVIINKLLKRWIEQAGITKHVTFHTSRHTAACLSIKLGNSIYATRDILGHQSTKHTEIYAKLLDEEKDKAMDRMP